MRVQNQMFIHLSLAIVSLTIEIPISCIQDQNCLHLVDSSTTRSFGFGSFEKFKQRFNTVALLIQGSGWACLGHNKFTKNLEIATTSNEDTLKDPVPLLGIDVWEHAYNLQYKENRAAYLKNIWEIINWKTVESRFADAIKQSTMNTSQNCQ